MTPKNRKLSRSDLQFACDAKIDFSKSEDGAGKFSMDGYTGARMQRWYGDIVVDLKGITLGTKRKMAILRDHNPGRIVGHGKPYRAENDHVGVKGTFSRSTPDGIEAEGLSGEAFPWQASISIDRVKAEEIPEGEKSEVNGRTEKGPVTIFRKSRLREVSFVVFGADSNTSAVAASDEPTEEIEYLSSDGRKEHDMTEEELKGKEAELKASADATKTEAMAAGDKAAQDRFAAFRKDFGDEFAVRMFSEGKTAEEAQKAHYRQVKVDLLAANGKLAEAQVKLAEDNSLDAGRTTPLDTGTRNEDAENKPKTFAAAVEKVTAMQKAANEFKSVGEAMRAAMEKYPDLHEASLGAK